MTYSDKLKAGPEMDAMVGKALGKEPVRYWKRRRKDGVIAWADKKPLGIESTVVECWPNWSTDDAEALKLVKELRLAVWPTPPGDEYWGAALANTEERKGGFGIAKTIALAVCRCVLMVKGNKR